MFSAARTIVENISKNEHNNNIHGEAKGAYKTTSFKFCFTLFLLNEVLRITDIIYQALQQKSQDILNALNSFSSTNNNNNKIKFKN
jgi:hypothetical protein